MKLVLFQWNFTKKGTREMNKPVAWQVAEMLFDIEESAIEMAKVYGDDVIPLYTHPVKELTDEEITELENALKACDYKYFGSYAFTDKQWDAFEVLEKHAKAILRKAQEK